MPSTFSDFLSPMPISSILFLFPQPSWISFILLWVYQSSYGFLHLLTISSTPLRFIKPLPKSSIVFRFLQPSYDFLNRLTHFSILLQFVNPPATSSILLQFLNILTISSISYYDIVNPLTICSIPLRYPLENSSALLSMF